MLSTSEYKERAKLVGESIGKLSILDLASMFGEVFCAYCAVHIANNEDTTEDMIATFSEETKELFMEACSHQLTYLAADTLKQFKLIKGNK